MSEILIVDNSDSTRTLMKDYIIKNNYYTVEAIGNVNNVETVLDKYFETRPRAIILDANIVKMVGLEVIKRIIIRDEDAKILIVSSMGQEMLVRDALIAGAKGFIVKPFKEDVVISTINRVL